MKNNNLVIILLFILATSFSQLARAQKIVTVIYDNLELKGDGLVYFYKDNKVGIFPRHKTVQYDSIQQQTNSFYKIYRNGKKGWLDIKTNKEYF